MEHAHVVQAYERLLVHRERFALADAVRTVSGSAQTLSLVQSLVRVQACKKQHSNGSTGATGATSTTTSSSKTAAASGRHQHAHHALAGKKPTFQDVMGAVASRAAHAETLIPVFLGHNNLCAFAQALTELVQTPEIETFWDLEMAESEKFAADMLAIVLRHLEVHCEALNAAIATTAPVAKLISQKRDHLATLLTDATDVLTNSHTRRQQQLATEQETLIDAFKSAVRARALCDAKQLAFELESIATSMATMLLPHFEICRTLTTANAQVAATAGFTSDECKTIDAFVQTARKLKEQSVGFHSVLSDVREFMRDLKLFERAASQDAFAVCSTALKLQFRESLDEELFHAYVSDWRDKKRAHELVESSAAFRSASQRLSDLRVQILDTELAIRKSQEDVIASDDPIRASLQHEVALLFNEEGGALDLCDAAFASPALLPAHADATTAH